MEYGRHVLTNFDQDEVVIPFVVIEELENRKGDRDASGKSARSCLNEIDRLFGEPGVDPNVGVDLDNGGRLRVERNHVTPILDGATAEDERGSRKNDTRIITVARNLARDEAKKPTDKREVVLVSNDTSLRLRARFLTENAIQVTKYTGRSVRFSGLTKSQVSDELLLDLVSNEVVDAPKKLVHEADGAANLAFELSGQLSGGGNQLCFYRKGKLKPFRSGQGRIPQVKTRNLEQKIAEEYLFDDELTAVSISGKAGSGKTMLSVSAGLTQCSGLNKGGRFERVLVYRPMFAVSGQEMGHLPGDMDEKMKPWKQPIYDSVHNVLSSEMVEKAQEDDLIDVESITYIRGRTLKNTLIIVDESQNFSELTLLEIMSRVGEGSKIVYLWDSSQRDNPHVGINDGPVALADRMKKHVEFAHVSLRSSQRSDLANLAGQYLEEDFS